MAEQSSPTLLPVPYPDERWMHAGAGHLALPINPITAITTTFKAFSVDESARIDHAWHALSDKDRRDAISAWGKGDGEGATKQKTTQEAPPEEDDPSMIRSGQEQKEDPEVHYKDLMAKVQAEEDLETIRGVPVSQVGVDLVRADDRTRYSRCTFRLCRYTPSFGRIPVTG